MRHALPLAALVVVSALASCTGETGERGPTGATGADGQSRWVTDRGVAVEVTDLSVGAGGATVSFTLSDDADGDPATPGAPLDRAGVLTAGPVTVGFVLAQLSGDVTSPGPYVAYTAVTDGGVLTVEPETSGTFETVDWQAGRYRYTFAAPLAGFDAAQTQTVLAVASRPFDGVTYRARALRSVLAAGGAPASRAVVAEARCADCHGRVTAHAEGYDAVAQCILCHEPRTLDPASGQPLDLGVMVHRIHRGEGLPSVVAGSSYALVDGEGTTHDFSTVRYPQSIERCDGCHGGAPQGSAWTTTVSFTACTSCHDTTSFEVSPGPGTVAHTGGPASDGECAGCHPPTGGTNPCTGEPCSVAAAHLDPSFDTTAPQLELQIRSATVAGPGQPLEVEFAVSVDGAPRDIQAAPLGALRATMAGPNGDFTTLMTVGTLTNPWGQATVQGTGASGTLVAVDAGQGIFRYTFPATLPVPADASGSWTVGLEGYVAAAGQLAARSPTAPFAVSDATPVARRSIVDPARCDACHFRLAAHGGSRRGAANCALCHGPLNTNADRVARLEGTAGVVAESLDLRVAIHKIHMGERLTRPYVLGSTPTPSTTNPLGTPVDFGRTRSPRSPAECAACHADPAPGEPPNWTLPLAAGASSRVEELTCSEDPTGDTDAYCTSPFWTVTRTLALRPETAACTSCHDAPYVRIHAELSTNADGEESCATCHGPGGAFDVEAVHAR